MPIEESEWVHQVFRYIHSPALLIQHDNSEFGAEEEKKLIQQKQHEKISRKKTTRSEN